MLTELINRNRIKRSRSKGRNRFFLLYHVRGIRTRTTNPFAVILNTRTDKGEGVSMFIKTKSTQDKRFADMIDYSYGEIYDNGTN